MADEKPLSQISHRLFTTSCSEMRIIMKRIVLTGGGTAGHVTPNIALLPSLKEAGYEVFYIGSYTGIEKQLIEDLEIPYYGISSGKLRRYKSLKNLSDPFRVLKGYFQARTLMRKIKPDIVFYGENLDEALLDRAFAELGRARLLLVLGSSLTVQPAASLPLATCRGGGKIVIVNAQPTPLDRYAALRYDDLQAVFDALAAEAWE